MPQTSTTEGLEGVLGVKEAAPVVDRASGGETTHSRQRKGEQESAAVAGFAVVRVGFQIFHEKIRGKQLIGVWQQESSQRADIHPTRA